MKIKLTIVFALAISVATGQKPDSSQIGIFRGSDSVFSYPMITFGSVSMVWMSDGGSVSMTMDKDSVIEIHGDTIKLMRFMIRMFQEQQRKYFDAKGAVYDLLEKVAGLRGTDAQIKKFYAAQRKYYKIINK